MSMNRSTTAITPAFIRAVAARQLRTSSRPLSGRIPAVALLVPTRAQSTDTSSQSGGSGNYPPPGYNSEQAKKPLPKQEQQQAQQSKDTQSAEASEAKQNPLTEAGNTLLESTLPSETPNHKPSAVPKTAAQDGRSLNELAAEKASIEEAHAALGKDVDKKKNEKKLTLWQKIKKEVAHYKDGTKLLAAEVKISSKLALKMAAGYELTRRENRQLQRTVQDLGRLVPFSVFVIVPFAELLLPIALRLFPNLLPSTYEGQKAKDAKATKVRSTRKEVSNFLRQTLKETGLPISAASAQSSEFAEFFRKVRSTGESPNAEDVIKVCKVFKDDLTLDNLSRPQLVGICRYMNLGTFGTDAMLRYQIRHRMRQIKRDDRAIAYEGVDSLSVPELQNACASRGIRTHGMSPGRLRDDLNLWVDLRLKHGIPSTLLVLSNAFVYAQGKDNEFKGQIEALQAVLASVPEELFHEIELEVHTAEGAATNKQRLEVLKEQQELIEEENEQSEEEQKSGKQAPHDHENIDDKEDTSPAAMEAKAAEAEAKDANAAAIKEARDEKANNPGEGNVGNKM